MDCLKEMLKDKVDYISCRQEGSEQMAALAHGVYDIASDYIDQVIVDDS